MQLGGFDVNIYLPLPVGGGENCLLTLAEKGNFFLLPGRTPTRKELFFLLFLSKHGKLNSGGVMMCYIFLNLICVEHLETFVVILFEIAFLGEFYVT